jgi:hypothetical protein
VDAASAVGQIAVGHVSPPLAVPRAAVPLPLPPPPPPGRDPCDVDASRVDTSAGEPPGLGGSDFQNLPAASWPRMAVPIQRPSARHVSEIGHVGVRCGAPAPEETDTAPTLASQPHARKSKWPPQARNQHQRFARLLRCPLPSASDRNQRWIRRPRLPEEMNGRGTGGGGGGEDEMEEDSGPSCAQGEGAGNKERVVLMWGYLPGVSPQRSPLLGPVPVRLPPTAATAAGDGWRDVCGGGCGFAMAISGDVSCSLPHCCRAYSLMLPVHWFFAWDVVDLLGVSMCVVFAPGLRRNRWGRVLDEGIWRIFAIRMLRTLDYSCFRFWGEDPLELNRWLKAELREVSFL